MNGLRLWVRVGDGGEYEAFGDDLEDLIGYLNELCVGTVTNWIDAGPGVGFDREFYGYDFISLFWGDANADLVAHLTDISGPLWRPTWRRRTSNGP